MIEIITEYNKASKVKRCIRNFGGKVNIIPSGITTVNNDLRGSAYKSTGIRIKAVISR